MKENFKELYLENYVFDSKRLKETKFIKYASKVVENLCIFINDYYFEFGKIEIQSDSMDTWYNFFEYIINYIMFFHYGHKENAKNSTKKIIKNMDFGLGNEHNLGIKYVSIPTIFENEKLSQNFFDMVSSFVESNVFYGKFMNCCVISIRRFVAKKSFKENIKIQNISDLYVNFLPNTFECLDILSDIISNFNYYALDVVMRYIMSDELSLETKKYNEELFAAFNSKEKECDEKSARIKELEEEITKLREMAKNEKQENTTQSIVTGFNNEKETQYQKEVLDLQRKNAKLERQLQDLRQKYEEFKSKALEEQVKDIVVEDIEECDVYKKYGFVVGENSSLQNKLLSRFVNSVILSGKTKSLDVDCVVFMTSCIGHSHYFKIKNMCDALGVPYRHCHFKNIGCVENTISKISIA